MLRLKDSNFKNTNSFLQRALRIANFYGFLPLEHMRDEKRRRQLTAPSAASGRSTLLPIRDNELSFARRDERPLLSAARLCATLALGNLEPLFLWRLAHVAKGADSR
ncbi:MAG: hypothetical protein U1A28_05265, partial [Patescibacteria group bacterium]|nr:hypothetical protein [Patescibacteria group bacterium]